MALMPLVLVLMNPDHIAPWHPTIEVFASRINAARAEHNLPALPLSRELSTRGWHAADTHMRNGACGLTALPLLEGIFQAVDCERTDAEAVVAAWLAQKPLFSKQHLLLRPHTEMGLVFLRRGSRRMWLAVFRSTTPWSGVLHSHAIGTTRQAH